MSVELHVNSAAPAGRVIDRGPSVARRGTFTITDCFIAANVCLAIVVWVLANHDRYYRLVDEGRSLEFLAYAALLLGMIGALWAIARRITFQTGTLLIAQLVTLMHFAGGW